MSTDPLRDALVARLEEENDELRERVRQLEAQLYAADDEWNPPIEWGLTRSEARVMSLLVARENASKEQIMAALYAGRAGGDKEVEIKIVDVFICKLRKKLVGYDVPIATLWGRGYALNPRTRKYLLDEHRSMLTPPPPHGRMTGT